MEVNPATVYLPFPAKRTGRSEGRGKVMMAEVTLHELAPGKEEGDEEAEEFVSEEEEKPAKKAKLYILFFQIYNYYMRQEEEKEEEKSFKKVCDNSPFTFRHFYILYSLKNPVIQH